MTVPLWRGYLVAGVLALGGFELLPPGTPQDIAYLLIGLLGVSAIALGQRIHAPAQRAPWRLMALGQLSWVVGDAVDSWHQDVQHSAPFPSSADLFYLSAYPVIGLGLLLLIRSRVRGRDLDGFLDSAILTAGLGLLSWVVLAHPTLHALRYSWDAAAVGVAYPAADILLVGLLIRLVTTSGAHAPAFRWLLAAVGLLIAGDTTYTTMSLGTATDAHLLNLLWLASYVAWGVAALHPSMTSLTQVVPTAVHFTRRRLVALACASLVAPGILAVERITDHRLDIWPVVVGSVVLFLLVVARMAVVIRGIVSANLDRERLQRSLVYEATHDGLTGVTNRAQGLHEIDAALKRARRTGCMLGILFVDLDGFKNVNDSLGHNAGDTVLQTVAAQLRDTVRGGDLVARFGGDEFVVVLENLTSEAEALQVAQRIVDLASTAIEVSPGRRVSVGASVGLALGRDASIDGQGLLHEADTAAYRAKRAGRGRVEVFDQNLRSELEARANLERTLTAAITNDDLVVHYQPIIDLASGSVTGYEALVRWPGPDGVTCSPDEFVPAAENSDLICQLDAWMLQHATAQLAAWNSAGPTQRTVAVNISGYHICQARIVDDVRNALHRSGLDARCLVLEVTETVLIDDIVAIDHLEQLRALGVAISIDDFGTGYNSITRLQHLPVDIIKIDRSFLDARLDPSLALLRLMVHTAHTFGLPVVVEGVEHPDQLDLLRSLNCEAAQGFLLGRPVPASAITGSVDGLAVTPADATA